jgi:TPR repeat protein
MSAYTKLLYLVLVSVLLASCSPGEDTSSSESERQRLAKHSALVDKANRADADAIYQQGVLNLNGGEGVPKRPEMAAALLRQAAELNHPASQNLFATMLANGIGVEQNNDSALHWYRKSAAQGNPWAQYNLGYAYHSGKGVAQDYAEAAKWYKLAAKGGIAQAEAQLGALHVLGLGVGQDLNEAGNQFGRMRDKMRND